MSDSNLKLQAARLLTVVEDGDADQPVCLTQPRERYGPFLLDKTATSATDDPIMNIVYACWVQAV